MRQLSLNVGKGVTKMNQLRELVTDYGLRILGGVSLLAAFVTLLMAPPKPAFSIVNLYLFITFILLGTLLIMGLIGPHPIAIRRRREARRTPATSRPRGAGDLPEQVFAYCPSLSGGRIFATAVSVLAGLLAIGIGGYVAWGIAGSWPFRLAAGFPVWMGGLIALWVPLRHLTMYVKIDANGLESRGYLRTATIRWEDVVALVAREHHMLVFGGFVSLGTVYTVYAQRGQLAFVSRLPHVAELAALISDRTGLQWS
jgi:hypothetical protein